MPTPKLYDPAAVRAFWMARNIMYPATDPIPLDTPIPIVSQHTLDCYLLFAEINHNPQVFEQDHYVEALAESKSQHAASIAEIRANAARQKSYQRYERSSPAKAAATADLLAGIDLTDITL